MATDAPTPSYSERLTPITALGHTLVLNSYGCKLTADEEAEEIAIFRAAFAQLDAHASELSPATKTRFSMLGEIIMPASDALEQPGDFCWLVRENGDVATLLLLCPSCGTEHGIGVKPGNPTGYDWNGDREKPTLRPSIFFKWGHGARNQGCRWHGYLTAGEWRDA
jgi:hypothetical protein